VTEFASSSTVVPEQWREWAHRNLAVTGDGLSLATRPAVDAEDLGLPAVDIAVALSGVLYALEADGRVRRYEPDTRQHREAWDGSDADPRALSVVGDRLYVADAGSGDLLVVSTRTRRVEDRIPADLVDPVAVVRRGRSLYVLDGNGDGDDDGDGNDDGANGRLLELRDDRTLETAFRGLVSPTALAIGPNGIASVLDEEDGLPAIRVLALEGDPEGATAVGTVDLPADPDTGDAIEPTSLVADEAGIVLGGTAGFGGPAALYRLERDGDVLGSVEHVVGLERRCDRLRGQPRDGENGRPATYAVIDGEVVALSWTRRNERNPTDGRYSGSAFRRIDSGTRGIQWHRATLGSDAPPSNARVGLRYYASDDGFLAGVAALDGVDAAAAEALRENGIEGVWDLVERDPETVARAVGDAHTDRAEAWLAAATDRIESGPEGGWKRADGPNPADVLLEAAEGRYLHVGIDVVGEATAAPSVHSFRAYCPRKTYLRYMPELFDPDEGGSAFLEAFLAVFESAYVDAEEEIEAITRLFDPRGTPRASLDWLAGWLATDLPDGWPEPAKRELLERSPALFHRRGTAQGLRDVLGIYLEHVETPPVDWMARWRAERLERRAEDGALDPERASERRERVLARDGENGDHLVWILEHADLDGLDEAGAGPYARYMRGPHSFVVYAGPFGRRRHRQAAKRIVERDRPAHAAGAVVELRHDCRLDEDTFLGVNSTLTSRRFELGRARLGRDAALAGDGP
jgi:phage tail-like protein